MSDEFGELVKAEVLDVGVTLFTRDGRVVGNAIVIEKFGDLWRVETDFGNQMTMTKNEVDAWYHLGHQSTVARWRRDRQQLQIQES